MWRKKKDELERREMKWKRKYRWMLLMKGPEKKRREEKRGKKGGKKGRGQN